MEPPRYPPMPSGIPFDVTFTDGTTSRVTVRERTFAEGPATYDGPGAPPALSPERAASKWALHQLALRSEAGDHASGIASIRRVHPPAPGGEAVDAGDDPMSRAMTVACETIEKARSNLGAASLGGNKLYGWSLPAEYRRG